MVGVNSYPLKNNRIGIDSPERHNKIQVNNTKFLIFVPQKQSIWYRFSWKKNPNNSSI